MSQKIKLIIKTQYIMRKIFIIAVLLMGVGGLIAQNYDYDDIYFDPVKDIVIEEVEVKENVQKVVPQNKSVQTTETGSQNDFTSTSTYTDRLNRFHIMEGEMLTIEGVSPFISDTNYVNLFMLGEGSYNVTVEGDRIDIQTIENEDDYGWGGQSPYYDIDVDLWGWGGSPYSYWDRYFYGYNYGFGNYWGYNNWGWGHHYWGSSYWGHHYYCGYPHYGHVPQSWWRKHYHGGHHHHGGHYYAYKNTENERRKVNARNRYANVASSRGTSVSSRVPAGSESRVAGSSSGRRNEKITNVGGGDNRVANSNNVSASSDRRGSNIKKIESGSREVKRKQSSSLPARQIGRKRAVSSGVSTSNGGDSRQTYRSTTTTNSNRGNVRKSSSNPRRSSGTVNSSSNSSNKRSTYSRPSRKSSSRSTYRSSGSTSRSTSTVRSSGGSTSRRSGGGSSSSGGRRR